MGSNDCERNACEIKEDDSDTEQQQCVCYTKIITNSITQQDTWWTTIFWTCSEILAIAASITVVGRSWFFHRDGPRS
jgi:hypothetical protein